MDMGLEESAVPIIFGKYVLGRVLLLLLGAGLHISF